MKFFSIVKADLFKPLTSKYKKTFLECLLIIYRTCRDESFVFDYLSASKIHVHLK